MSTVVEDPHIPLVENGGRVVPTYTSSSTDVEQASDSGSKSTQRKIFGGAFGPFNTKAYQKYKTDNVGYRLSKRKELFQRKQKIAFVSMLLALFGILIMIIEMEFVIANVINKTTSESTVLKAVIFISTIFLLASIMVYYSVDIKLWLVDNSLDDWRLALSCQRICLFCLEIFICSICPLPGVDDQFTWKSNLFYKNEKQEATERKVSVDILLSIPMFLRLYLVYRAIMLYSKLFTDARSQSLGALNRVDFNFRFIFKSYMSTYSEVVIFSMMMSILFIGAWAMRACEMHHDEKHSNLLNTMWIVAITFLTVGYGDIVPATYCGRTISVLVGIFGTLCTALLVAVLARKLEMSRMEKYVHNFVTDVDLEKQNKNAAASILREGWLVYRSRRIGNLKDARKHQRQLLHWIHELRNIKAEQRRMLDNSVTLVEMHLTQNSMYDTLHAISSVQISLSKTVENMNERMKTLEEKFETLHRFLKERKTS